MNDYYISCKLEMWDQSMEVRYSELCNDGNKSQSLVDPINLVVTRISLRHNTRLIILLKMYIKTKQTSCPGAEAGASAGAGGAILPRIRVINLRNA